MEYDLKLQHKKGSKMVVADTLSQRADWSIGLEHDNKDVVALPESLWIRLVDMELQDAVAVAQKEDTLVQDAVSKLSDPSVFPQRWTIETSGPDSSTCLLFYNGRLYPRQSRLAMSNCLRPSRLSCGRTSGISRDVQKCLYFLLVAWYGYLCH